MKPRKPGDQAPPFRPTHRNPGNTARTHVKSTAGKLYLVHDGAGNTLELDGVRAESMSYDDARRFKDYAVTKHKQRRASIVEMQPSDVSEAPPTSNGSTVDVANPDPVLERQRQAALAAARPVAAAANARVAAAQSRPVPPPPKKPTAQQRSPGWEPPPDGTTGARQAPKPPAKNAPVVRAPGFEAPTGGAKSTAPETAAAVEIDPIEGDDSLELDGTDEVTELLSGGGDLESEVKRVNAEAENQIIEACKALKAGDIVVYFTEESEEEVPATVLTVHAPTCITLQLGEAGADGPVLKSVMLTPKEGKRGGTWQPTL